MSKKIISLALIFCFLFTMVPMNAFAQNESKGEEKTGVTIETIDKEGTLRITVPIKNSDLKLVPNTSQKPQGNNRNNYTVQKIEPNVPSQDGAGQLINAAAAIFWDVDYWEFSENDYKVYLDVSRGPHKGTRIAEALIEKPALGASSPDGVTKAVNETNFQFKTTKDYKKGYENEPVAAVYEVRLKFNAIVANGEYSDQSGGPDKIIYYIIITQIAMPVYTTEWFDTNESTRPNVSGELDFYGNKVNFNLFETNLRFGTMLGDKADGVLPVYVDEKDMNGTHIGYMNRKGTEDDQLPKGVRRDINVEKFGSLTKDNLTLTRGKNLKLTGKFVSYEGVKEGQPNVNETKNLGNRSGKIPAFSKTEADLVNMTFKTVKYPAYFYFLAGDNDHLWRFQMREVLKVKLNSGAGMVGTEKGKDLKVGGKDSQEIGHGEMIKDNESGHVISFKTDKTITVPKVKIAGQDVDATFAGWATEPQTLDDVKDSKINGLKLVKEDNETLTAEGKAYKFLGTEKDKEIILYAVFTAPKEGKINVKYVDSEGNDLTKVEPSVKIDGETYPAFAEGEKDKDVDATTIPQPKFIGYKRVEGEPGKVDVTGKKYKEEKDLTDADTVEVKYEKLDPIIPEDEASEDVKNTYKKVTIKVDSAKGKFKQNKADTSETSFTYYVNPLEGKTLDNVLKFSKLEAESKTEADKIDADNPWKYTPAKTTTEPEADVKKETEVNDKNFKKVDVVVMEVNFIKEQGTVKYVYAFDTTEVKAPATAPANPTEATGLPKLPEDKKNYDVGSEVNAETTIKQGRAIEVKDAANKYVVGKWIFQGWNPEKVTIAKGENTFTGTWKYIPEGKKAVSYEFKDMDGNALPAVSGELNKFPEISPKDTNTYYVGEEITLPTTPAVGTEVKGTNGTDSKGKAIEGTWKFEGWYNGDTKLSGATVKAAATNKFVGKWSFDETGKGYIQFAFKAAKGTLPKEVTKIQEDLNKTLKDEKHYVGAKFTPDALTTKTVTIDKGENQGTWTTTWTPSEITIKQGKNEVEVTWTFEPKAKRDVTYKFKYVKDGAELTEKPAEIKISEPETIKDQYVGTEITPKALEKTSYEVKDDQGNVIGIWSFDGWKPTSLKVVEEPTENDNKFIGTWTYGKKLVMSYKFEVKGLDEIPAKTKVELNKYLPKTDYIAKGSNYEPKNPTKTIIKNVLDEKDEKVYDYTFEGWNPEKLDKAQANQEFIGTWTRKQSVSEPPTVVTPKEGDKTIGGKGKPGSDIIVKTPDGKEHKGKVNDDGDWTIDIPEAKDGDDYIVTQIEKGKKESEKVTVHVRKKGNIEVEYPISEIYVGDYKTVTPEIYGTSTTETDEAPFVVNRRKLEDMGVTVKAHSDGRLTIEIGENYRGPKRFTIDLDVYVDGQEIATYADVIVLEAKTRRPEAAVKTDDREILEHKAYIFGYPDGSVRPQGNITRAEAAAMIARLLNIEAFGSNTKPMFPDTPSAWYNRAINAVVQRGIMKGYPDGSFKPNDPITRAEFTTMIAAIDNKAYGVAPFADVKGHWAELAIGREYQAGRINGYPDGTFRPQRHITRAEAATILNKIFDRCYDAMSLIGTERKENVRIFTDLFQSFWGYNDMVEATNNHSFKRRVEGRVEEDWIMVK